jgi:hypothetical protein
VVALARHLFGGSIADFVVAPGGSVTVDGITGNETLLVPGVVIQFYDAASAGNAITDLEDLTLTAQTTVTTDINGAIPQFYGPDAVTLVWADANGGAGPRRLMLATDSTADIATNTTAITTLQGTVTALAPVAASGNYADLTGAPVLAAVATSGAYADLSGKPVLGMQAVVESGGVWPLRNTTAPDTSRPAEWIGPTAPPAGGGYAQAGDLWDATPS